MMKKVFALTASIEGQRGSGELTETIKAVSGTPKGVLPVADLGWHFVKWVDSKEGSPSYSITGLYPTAVNGVFEGETYTAIFEKNIETIYTISSVPQRLEKLNGIWYQKGRV